MLHLSSASTDFSVLTSGDDDAGDEEDDLRERLSQKYRIRLHATNLPTRGVLRGSAPPDTFAVVTSAASPGTPATPFISRPRAVNTRNISDVSNSSSSSTSVIWGQTEVVYKSSNPQWTGTVTLDYVTGSRTFFYVHLFHYCPGRPAHLKSFGTALFRVADLLAMKNFTHVKRLRSEGCVFCRLEAVRDSSNVTQTVRLQLHALNLVSARRTVFGRNPDTVLEIAKREATCWLVVHRSAPVKASTDPIYDAVNLNLEDFCGSDFDRHLRISIYSVKANQAKRFLIGIAETTLKHLLSNSEQALNVIGNIGDDACMLSNNDEEVGGDPNPTVELRLQRNSERLEEVGRIRVRKASLRGDDGSQKSFPEQAPFSAVEIVDLSKLAALAVPDVAAAPMSSFSSHIERGCQIDFCVAIDFTSSNGDPAHEGSNHHLGENTLNDYEETITAIGRSLARYSESEEYAVWGFGAKFGGVVRHIFQCGPTPTVTGVGGILAAYKYIFQSDLIMSGPTVFTQVLQAAAVRAKRNHEIMRCQPRYTVLLVITDGIMDNFEETRRRLDVYCGMPLSVIFVGVGRSDFGLMWQLCQPTSGSRSNTTFVEFRRLQQDPAALGEAALRNIPTQLCEYMHANLENRRRDE